MQNEQRRRRQHNSSPDGNEQRTGGSRVTRFRPKRKEDRFSSGKSLRKCVRDGFAPCFPSAGAPSPLLILLVLVLVLLHPVMPSARPEKQSTTPPFDDPSHQDISDSAKVKRK